MAVDDHWLLTAAHVADDTRSSSLSISSSNYNWQKTVYHDKADLAPVRYEQEFPGFYNLYTNDMVYGQEVIMVGYGNTGTVSQTTHSDSGSGTRTKR